MGYLPPTFPRLAECSSNFYLKVEASKISNSPYKKLFRQVIAVAVWVLGFGVSAVWAQKDTLFKPVRVSDSVNARYRVPVTDSMMRRTDSLLYTRFKLNMYKRRVTRQLYDALFRDVYNSQLRTGEVNAFYNHSFKEFAGRVIGTIYVRRLDVFGQSVYDTLRKSNSWFERLGSRLHANTKEHVIRRQFLLFQEGDLLDPVKLRDNERILRNTPIFHDARILVVPRPGSRQFVDVYVITQDIWSLLPDGGVGGLNKFSIGLEDRNFRGIAHQLYNRVNYDGKDPRQKLEYQGRYTIPYINAFNVKTFVTAQADLYYLRDFKQLSIKLFRTFLTPDTKYAGALQLSNNAVRNYLFDRYDSLQTIRLNYFYSDAWIGRAFKLYGLSNDSTRARLVVAVRSSSFHYFDRPVLTADSNQLYQNTRTTLFSLGYSQRRYVRDVLIYGFGRTEDVPFGNLFSVVGGVDRAELGERGYIGVNFSRGQYLKNRKAGYLYTLTNLGGYYHARKIEQGLFAFTANYFSPLHRTKWGNMRHFLNVRYTHGSDRFNNEYITLSGQDGLGINSDNLRGTKRLLIGYENVLFSDIDFVGFRIAIIAFANLGLVSFPEHRLLAGPLYQGYGLGFRFRNENLTFNSFQIRLTYYPTIPNNSQALRFAFEGVPALRLRDFDINAPEIIPYR